MNKDLGIKRELLRHIVATLAYRGGKSILNAPEGFSNFKINDGTRTPGEILAHIGDLLDWSLRLVKGQSGGLNSESLKWEEESARFFSLIKEFDTFLASGATLQQPVEKIIQGPIADALTHVGQIALLRRIAGSPVRGENYFKADITVGLTGPDQSTKRFEFD